MPVYYFLEHHSAVHEVFLFRGYRHSEHPRYSEHLPEYHTVVPKATPPAPSEKPTAADLIDLHLQFSWQDSFDSRSIRRQIIPRFEHCSGPCSSMDGYSRQYGSL